jgi:hypothetical protein
MENRQPSNLVHIDADVVAVWKETLVHLLLQIDGESCAVLAA